MARKAVKRWEDNQITGIGRRNARTSFYKDSQKRMRLNGQWAFMYLDAPELSPEGFEQPGSHEGYENAVKMELGTKLNLWNKPDMC